MPVFSSDIAPGKALKRAVSILSGMHPGVAERLAKTLDVVLHDIVSHPRQDRAWNYSQLNGNGAPLEFTFSTLGDEVRYAVEIGGPDLPVGERLEAAARLLARLEVDPSYRAVIDRFRQLQESGDLTWGAWLGIRHLQGGDEYKIYAQTPAVTSTLAAEIIEQYMGAIPAIGNDRQLNLVAIGQTPGSPRLEFYFRATGVGLRPEELAAVLRPFGLQDGQEELWSLLQSVRVRIGDEGEALPQIPYGFSCSILPGRQAPVCSVFAFADQLIGSDALVCLKVVQTVHCHGWSLGAYVPLVEPLAQRFFSKTMHHNVVGFLLAPGLRTGIHISLSPPLL